jgi:uncharacterized protein YukE
MLIADGGGSISVEPAAISGMAAKVNGIATSTSSTRGSIAGTAGAAGGCQDPAAAAYARMQFMLSQALASLDDATSLLGQAIGAGVEAYVVTDATQMGGSQSR